MMPGMDIKAIHIVEPDVVWRHFFKQRLSDLDRAVSFYESGSDLLQNVDGSASVIVVEAKLPDFSWGELLSAVRNREEFARTPYVLMSADVDRELVEGGLGMGAQAVLHKQAMNPAELTRFFAQYV